MVNTPSQHNSTLFISPLINNRNRPDIFITPPNPPTNLFDTPGSNSTTFFHLDQNPHNNQQPHPLSHQLNNPTANHNSSNFTEEPLSQAEKLRLWRHDALMQHHYKTAEYIGDKVLALTNDPNDAFWLAQVHYSTGNYLRARQLLSGHTFEQSVSCRYLAALCLVQLEEWDDALDLIGESNPFKKDENYQIRNQDGGIKLEASMCYLRGKIYANQNNFLRAKECYKEALLVDVKCFEAFEELCYNNLMTSKEEWDLINSLNFRDADDNDELVKLLYTTKLSKYVNVNKFEDSEAILKEEFNLGGNSDLLLARADLLYIQCKFEECLEICEKILMKDNYNFQVLPNYLSCLYELGGKNKLFLKAHELASDHPKVDMTWLAIGIYYLSIGKVGESRRYFSKATLINSNFGHAWIGFAHTFAAEGEHEQAISGYAFAARLFPGTHLPNLFLGMQYLQMNNLTLAEEYLLTSRSICSNDPLLLNELGVINYHKNDLKKAEFYLNEALSAARYLNSDSKTWISIHANLGHVYRKSNSFQLSLQCFQQVLKITTKDPNIYAAIGLVYLKIGDYFRAIEILHNALAISPTDPVSNDLLKRALEQNAINTDQFNSTSSKLIELNRKFTSPAKNYNTYLNTPLIKKSKVMNFSGVSIERDDKPQNIEEIVQKLREGEESSDEDDEIMDVESD